MSLSTMESPIAVGLRPDVVDPIIHEMEQPARLRPIGKVATYGLVHGAWHGAWCWDYLSRELEQAGHETVAVDLPIEDPDAKIDDYAEVVADSLRLRENIILVGHSMAGIIIPRVAEIVKVNRLVYLNAALRLPGLSLEDSNKTDLMPPRNPKDFLEAVKPFGEAHTIIAPDDAKEYLYNDCHPDIADWAVTKLRPQAAGYKTEVAPSEEPLRVPSTYITGAEDLVVNPEWSAIAAREWLGVEPLYIPSGHSPFLSRPKPLADILLSLK